MNNFTTLKNLLYSTIHRNKKSVQHIADETGISANYLYRAGLPLDESGVKFPVEFLIPLMNSTKNYSVLNYLANMCGFLLVKIPRIARNKKEEIDIIDEYQTLTVDAVKKLKDFFSTPTKHNYDLAAAALTSVMEKSASAKKVIDKSASGQFEMDL